MKPYTHIENSKRVIKTMLNEAKQSVNVKSKLEDLNVLINLVNSFEEMLLNKYHTDFFDIVVLSRMYQTLIKSKEDVNIKEFLYWFEKDFREGKDYILENITGYLQGIQIENSLESGELFQDSKEDWENVIKDTLNQIKTNIIWSKKWKK